MTTTAHPELEGLGRYKFGWADSDSAGATARRGLSEDVVRDISAKKDEPEWMLKLRLKGLSLFRKKPMPTWGSDLGGIDFENIKYFVRSTEKQATTWDEPAADIKNTYDKLGIPEAEKQRLVGGVAAQYESEVVYHQIREDLEEKGVIFARHRHRPARAPRLFREYFGSVIPPGDNKFACAQHRRWSGGSFIYVPPGVHIDIPLQALLPDQHREHGPVRAHADHRRRGLVRSLRRGLHRPDLQERLAAQRCGRDHREEDAHVRLHDDPELVEQRLQPRHQAAPRPPGRPHGVDRRQHRLQGHDEVPGLPTCSGEHATGETLLGRLRRRGPAPGRRRQDGARGSAHVEHDRQKSVARGGAGRPYRGSCRCSRGAHHSRSTCAATRCSSTRSAAPTPTPYVDVREDDVAMGHEATVSKVSRTSSST
jgi:Fe-S cluster assembly protein SufB